MGAALLKKPEKIKEVIFFSNSLFFPYNIIKYYLLESSRACCLIDSSCLIICVHHVLNFLKNDKVKGEGNKFAYKLCRRGHCKMLELQVSKFVDPAFYTDHDDMSVY